MFWDNGYKRTKPPGWQRPSINEAFTHWFKSSSPAPTVTAKKVLVPGCGTAEESLEFTRMGNHVTMIEIAPTALDIQRKKYMEASLSTDHTEFVFADLLNVWKPTKLFDIVYEQTCLCAIEPSDRVKYERIIYSCLKPGGDLYILFMQTRSSTSGPPFHCDMMEMKRLFSSDRWHWQSNTAEITSPHPMGVTELGFHLVKI